MEYQQFKPSSALFIEHILAEILSYLRLPDLLQCRQVCTQWDTQAVAILIRKKLGKIKLYDIYFTRYREGIKNLTSAIHSSKKIFYTNVTLECIPKNNNFSDPGLFKFFQLCGSHIKHFEVEIKIDLNLDIRGFVRKLSKLAVNLESLHLINFPKYGKVRSKLNEEKSILPKLKEFQYSYKDPENYPIIAFTAFKTLFESTPNLRIVKIADYSRFEDLGGQNEDYPVLKGLLESGRLATIIKLQIGLLGKQGLKLLKTESKKKQLNLEEFSFKFIDFKPKNRLNKFLTSQQKTLKKLEIGEPAIFCHDFADEIQPREMGNLEEITMNIWPDKFRIKSLNPLEDFPKLRAVIVPCVFSITAEKLANTFSCLSVTQLEVSLDKKSVDYNFHKGDINQYTLCSLISLGEIFPSVQSLTLSYPTRDQVKNACASWKELKHLRINLRKTDYRKEIEDITSCDEMLNFFPNIRSLKKLQTFSIAEYREDSPGLFEPRLFVRVDEFKKLRTSTATFCNHSCFLQNLDDPNNLEKVV